MPRFEVAWAACLTVFAVIITLIFIDSVSRPWNPYIDSVISSYVVPAIVTAFVWTAAGWLWIAALRKPDLQ